MTLALLLPLEPVAELRRARISVEELLRWAYAPGREGGQVWRVDTSTLFDRGLTANLRRRPCGSWVLAEACAGMKLQGLPLTRATATSDRDAILVASAVMALPATTAELLRRHGRGRSRPDWLETQHRLEPILNDKGKGVIRYTNNKNKLVPYCPLKLVIDRVQTPAAICRWLRWREGLETVADRLADRLERWEINGYLPPAEPWRKIV